MTQHLTPTVVPIDLSIMFTAATYGRIDAQPDVVSQGITLKESVQDLNGNK